MEQHANTIRRLRAENQRLQLEVERAWQQVRQLKAREDMRFADLAFSETSRSLAKRVEDALADLEFMGNPREAIKIVENISQGRASETPIPGQATRRDRERLETLQRKLQKTLAWYEQTQQDDLLDNQKVYVPRPKCKTCGLRGQVGWTHCPNGHGPYKEDE